MAPMVASDIMSVVRAQESFSFIDLTGYSTIIKDAFLDDGLLQTSFATKNTFTSGSNSEMPLMFWKKKKRDDNFHLPT
jgi:hypothetical protein